MVILNKRADNNITYKFCISFIYSHPFIVNNLFSSSVTPRRRREPVGRYARRTRHEWEERRHQGLTAVFMSGASLLVTHPWFPVLPSPALPTPPCLRPGSLGSLSTFVSRREPTRRGGDKGTRREPGQGGDRREPTSLIHRKQTTVDRSIINIRAKEQNRKDI